MSKISKSIRLNYIINTQIEYIKALFILIIYYIKIIYLKNIRNLSFKIILLRIKKSYHFLKKKYLIFIDIIKVKKENKN